MQQIFAALSGPQLRLQELRNGCRNPLLYRNVMSSLVVRARGNGGDSCRRIERTNYISDWEASLDAFMNYIEQQSAVGNL